MKGVWGTRLRLKIHFNSDILFSLSASMSVKDILQSLVDDSLVDSDRIGTSNYFWAFPSKAVNNVSLVFPSKKRRNSTAKIILISRLGYSSYTPVIITSLILN